MSRGALMRAEIAEQPGLWLNLTRDLDAVEAAAELLQRREPELLVLAARGSSDHAAMYAQYLAHNELHIPAALSTPASVTAYDTHLRYPRSVALAVSQSGSSPDLLASVRSLLLAQVPVITYTNDPASELASLGDLFVDLAAGPELSVAATKTYTAELLTLGLTILLVAGHPSADLIGQVTRLAEKTADTLASTSEIDAFTDLLHGHEKVLVIGRGLSMSTAREGALKLMETSTTAASGWSAADATHGPLGQVVAGTPVVLLTAGEASRASVLDFAEKAREAGATLLEIGAGVLPGAAAVVRVPEVDQALVPVAEIVPLQRIALELSLARGLDPDQPASLKKITKTT